MAPKTFVTRASLAAGAHPTAVLDAMNILLADPIPKSASEQAAREASKVVDEDGTTLTVFEVMMKYNVIDMASNTDTDDCSAVDEAIDDVFNSLSKGHNKIVALPSPRFEVDVYVDASLECPNKDLHTDQIRSHVLQNENDVIVVMQPQSSGEYIITSSFLLK